MQECSNRMLTEYKSGRDSLLPTAFQFCYRLTRKNVDFGDPTRNRHWHFMCMSWNHLTKELEYTEV